MSTANTRASAAAWWIALRYVRTRRREFAAFVTRVSVIGLTLGVLVLTVVVSVMNGFDAELRSRILGTVAHLLIEDARTDDPDLAPLLQRPDVVSAFNVFVGSGMVSSGGAVNPVSVYGIDETARGALPTIESSLQGASLEALVAQPRGILLGAPLAAHLGLLPGDTLALVISEPGPGGVTPRLLRYQLAGTFEVGAELDYSLAIVATHSLPAGALERLGRSGVRVTVDDPLAAPAAAAEFAARLPRNAVSSWADDYGELFQAVRLEKFLMFLILLMVVAVAAFNIVSGQSMAVIDKRADIAILRTMGASDGTVLRVFLMQGLLVSGIGIAVGLALGVVVARHINTVVGAAERWTGFRLLEGTYFIEVPSVVQLSDLIWIALISGSLCLLSAWIPARRAAALNPLAGLHG